MKMIVGLGNPGRRYEGTRHNVGFDSVLAVAKSLGADRSTAKFDADYFDLVWQGERLLLVRPLTFMNLSGQSVRKFADFFRIPLSEILVICDDLALPPGTLRMRPEGSSGGQKGLQNICDLMGSTDVPRLRIGIGSTPEGWETANFVLSKWSGEDLAEIEDALSRAVDAVKCWVRDGIGSAMNQFNGSSARDKRGN